jgi:nitroimidazol reductase NimA-like FMN-containing flavoprotein (pyridoxamine 5'-phosphate oxidase superfamily)
MNKIESHARPEVTPLSAQRIPEYAQDDEWIQSFLLRARIGHVATRREDQPFITPTTFWYDEKRHEIIFHSNIVGQVRTNIERHNRVCFETSEAGRFLPSNVALEFSVQYASVVVFGTARIIDDADEKRRALYGLIKKYFQDMTAGVDYRPITDQELSRTSVYAISVESWSGKQNWPEEAEQSDEEQIPKSTESQFGGRSLSKQ